MSDILLEANHLQKQYPGVNAVNDLHFQVHAGEVVGLLGANGAGKTTSLRMLAGILTPSHGYAEVCGTNPVDDPLSARQNIGFLSGDTALYRRMSPREILQYFGRLHDMSDYEIKEQSEQLIQRLGMKSFADRYCSTLSSGQVQRANIARTLIHNPSVLILDEPTNTLDIITGQFILDAIREAKQDNRAILFSTHYMAEAEALCDRIVILHEGEVCATGTLDELKDQTSLEKLADIFLHFAGKEEISS